MCVHTYTLTWLGYMILEAEELNLMTGLLYPSTLWHFVRFQKIWIYHWTNWNCKRKRMESYYNRDNWKVDYLCYYEQITTFNNRRKCVWEESNRAKSWAGAHLYCSMVLSHVTKTSVKFISQEMYFISLKQHKKLQAKDIPLPPTPSSSRFQRCKSKQI